MRRNDDAGARIQLIKCQLTNRVLHRNCQIRTWLNRSSMLSGGLRPSLLGQAKAWGAAALSTGAEQVISEMVGYARQNFQVSSGCSRSWAEAFPLTPAPPTPPPSQSNPEQAMDVLKSGLGYKNTGPDAGRWDAAGGLGGS